MRRAGVLAAALFVAGLTAVVAAPSLHYGFVYDDEAIVLERKPFWELGLIPFLQSTPYGTGRHLTAISLDLDRLAGGDVPLPFHRTNIVLAALLSATLLGLALRIGLSLPAATAAAALFAVHPVHVDSVAWITGRSELLAALGVVAAVLVAIRPDKDDPHPWRVAIACALFGILGVHSKENALCLPILLVVARLSLGRRVAWVPAMAGTSVALVSWAVWIGPLLSTFGRPEFVDNPLIYAPVFERIPKALAILWHYAGLLVWPHPLLQDRSWRATDPGLLEGWLAAIVWLAAAVGVWRLRLRAPAPAFALAWFPAAFALTANVISPIGTLMAERLMLLPSVSVCLLAGVAFDAAAKSTSARRAAAVLTTLVVAVLFVLFRQRAAVWENSDLYFRTAVAESPTSAKAQYDYGSWMLRKGDRPEAEAAFARALAIVPSLSRAAFMRAESMAKRGDTAGGVDVYLAYLATTPGDTGAITNVTRLLIKAGRPDEAVVWARRLWELAPGESNSIDTMTAAEAAATAARDAAAKSPHAPDRPATAADRPASAADQPASAADQPAKAPPPTQAPAPPPVSP